MGTNVGDVVCGNVVLAVAFVVVARHFLLTKDRDRCWLCVDDSDSKGQLSL